MKFFIYILLAFSVGIVIFNSTQIDYSAPFQGDSIIAAICTLAAASVVLLLLILLVSRQISEKTKG